MDGPNRTEQHEAKMKDEANSFADGDHKKKKTQKKWTPCQVSGTPDIFHLRLITAASAVENVSTDKQDDNTH